MAKRDNENMVKARLLVLSKMFYELTEEQGVPKPEDFNPSDYSHKVFEMFDGEDVRVTLECKDHLMKYIIDRFGMKVETEPADGGDQHEPQDLYNCYKESLNRAKENDCHSIGFPLISAGIFGYPKDKAWRKALQSCDDWLSQNPDYKMDIVFAVLDQRIYDLGQQIMEEMGL